MGVTDAMALSIEASNYACTVAQPTSSNVMSKGFGGRNYNDDGATHSQDGGEPTALDYHYRR